MDLRSELAFLEKRLGQIKLRLRLESVLREKSSPYKVCTRCNRIRDTTNFSVIVAKDRHGRYVRARFHSWCDDCRSERKKLKRQQAFSQQLANRCWE